jgi:segregation and condensation protein A
LYTRHQIQREPLSVRARMSLLLELLGDGERHRFSDLLHPQEGRLGVVVTFLALLELTRQALLELTQESAYAPILVRLRGEAAVRDSTE